MFVTMVNLCGIMHVRRSQENVDALQSPLQSDAMLLLDHRAARIPIRFEYLTGFVYEW